ncbi:MAG: cryptochrome/photolyase family protein, partial [Lutimaribacter sp.]
MISQELNDSLTRVGPGKDAGRVLRQYWQPAALSDELMVPRPVVPVTLLGERLVLFRDETGALGLIGRHCPHRGADMCFGRLEDNGLRCPFHGWHFDRSGQCIEQPGEPEGGQWNFDHDNRGSFPAGGPQGVPAPVAFPPDAVTADVIAMINR